MLATYILFLLSIFLFFFFNDTATTEIYTLSLHDALPIWILAKDGLQGILERLRVGEDLALVDQALLVRVQDRKSTRLNSSHITISYAVFCLKKKKNNEYELRRQRYTTISPYYDITIS